MHWKKLSWSGFAGLLFCSFALRGCSKPEPQRIVLEKSIKKLELNGEKFDLEKSTIIQYYNPKSKNIVAFVMEQHFPKEGTFEDKNVHDEKFKQSSAIHREIYKTLDELASENNSKFLGLEAYYGEFSKDHLDFTPKLLKAIFKMIADTEYEGREEMIEHFSFNHGVVDASNGFELVEDEKIFSYGVEDKDLHKKAIRIWKDYRASIKRLQKHKDFIKTEKWGKLTDEERVKIGNEVIIPWFELKGQFDDLVVRERSRVFVDKLMDGYNKWSKDGNKSKVLILVGGGLHYKTVAERLEELNISYIIVKPDSYKIR